MRPIQIAENATTKITVDRRAGYVRVIDLYIGNPKLTEGCLPGGVHSKRSISVGRDVNGSSRAKGSGCPSPRGERSPPTTRTATLRGVAGSLPRENENGSGPSYIAS